MRYLRSTVRFREQNRQALLIFVFFATSDKRQIHLLICHPQIGSTTTTAVLPELLPRTASHITRTWFIENHYSGLCGLQHLNNGRIEIRPVIISVGSDIVWRRIPDRRWIVTCRRMSTPRLTALRWVGHGHKNRIGKKRNKKVKKRLRGDVKLLLP